MKRLSLGSQGGLFERRRSSLSRGPLNGPRNFVLRVGAAAGRRIGTGVRRHHGVELVALRFKMQVPAHERHLLDGDDPVAVLKEKRAELSYKKARYGSQNTAAGQRFD